MKRSVVLTKDQNLFMAKIAPSHHELKVFHKQPNDALLTFEAGYTCLGRHFGLLVEEPCDWSNQGWHTGFAWPTLSINFNGKAIVTNKASGFMEAKISIPAGPQIIKAGHVLTESHFRDDFDKVQEMICVGATRSGELVVVWSRNLSLNKVAKLLSQQRCISAMKVAGHTDCYLRYEGEKVKFETGRKPKLGVQINELH